MNPDLRRILGQLEDIEDPAKRHIAATQLIDEVRDVLLPELAAIRRTSAVLARERYMEQGMARGEATRTFALEVGSSPQVIARMLTERKIYGG